MKMSRKQNPAVSLEKYPKIKSQDKTLNEERGKDQDRWTSGKELLFGNGDGLGIPSGNRVITSFGGHYSGTHKEKKQG